MTLPAINNLETTLTVLVLIGDTTINVASTTGWPASGICSIEHEVISYTGKTGTTFTGCTRGYDSTAAAAHALLTSGGDAQPVELRIIAGHVTEIHDKLNLLSSQYTAYYNNASAIDFLSIPNEYRLESVEVMIQVPFDGVGAGIQVGTAGTPGRYVDTTDLDLTADAGTWFSKKANDVGPVTVRLTNTPGSTPTQGQAIVITKLVPL